ncbi:hypothetical protein RAE21_12135 [Rhodoferax sp. TBRC 17198]|uniref:hypothetical protein n=1 Tax=Rhodoferax potami TaxID=3068338 RepID=UPI0028BDB334|nr:hypothetical protein [Rhodoferax sp. TBRC 17198]MDT7523149.1 hypothetical protein [Rhodoferax sp. TBRC 17198]
MSTVNYANNSLNLSWLSNINADVGQPPVNTGLPPPSRANDTIIHVSASSKAAPRRDASPALSAPLAANFNSSEPLPASASTELLSQGSTLNDFLLGLTKSLDVKMSTAFRNSSMTMDDVIETVRDGLVYACDKQKMQAEIIQKVHKKAIQEASEAASAGILSKIFGWIAQIFAAVALVLSTVALLATGQVGLAALTIGALVLTVMEIASSISQHWGGPDISLAGFVAAMMKIGGHGAQVVEDVRKWLGLAFQIVTAVMGAVGGGFAASALKASTDAVAKSLQALVTLLSGLTAIASGSANIVSAKENMELAEIQTLEMQSQAFLDFLAEKAKRYADDLQGFRDVLDTFLTQRQKLLSSEDALNKSISA